MRRIRAAARRWGWVVLLPLWLLGGAAPEAAAAERLPEALAGTWHGTVAESMPGTALKQVQVELQASGSNGVAARWTALDGSAQSAQLVPGKRPGVLAPAAGGLMAMLREAEVPNPLEGEPLLWARRDERGLYIYRLELAAGGALSLDRYAFEPGADGRLAFTASRSDALGEVKGRASALLERQD